MKKLGQFEIVIISFVGSLYRTISSSCSLRGTCSGGETLSLLESSSVVSVLAVNVNLEKTSEIKATTDNIISSGIESFFNKDNLE